MTAIQCRLSEHSLGLAAVHRCVTPGGDDIPGLDEAPGNFVTIVTKKRQAWGNRMVLITFRPKLNSFAMTRLNRLMGLAVAATIAGSISLSGCSATKEAASGVGDAAKNAATATGDAAQTAASATAQAALAPAVNPVLDLLNKGQSDIKGGNLTAAVTAMGGFQALWDKAAPVIQPLAGDKWPLINTAARTVISTFASGAKPDANTAGSAITGLIGPLSALIGK